MLIETITDRNLDPPTAFSQLQDRTHNEDSRSTHGTTDLPSFFSFLQLNCHISKEIMLSLLHHPSHDSILLWQEPWVNPYTLLPPTHPNWHMLTSYNHITTNWRGRHKCCVYIHKSVPSEAMLHLPGSSKHLLGVTLQGADKNFTIVNVYNPPGTNAGLKDLEQWLPTFHNWQNPMGVFMDSNLHHKM